MSDLENGLDLPDNVGDDLFGDGGDDDIETQSDNAHVLSDKDVASEKDAEQDAEQDAGEQDGYEDVDMDGQEVKDKLVQEIQTYRHRTPKTNDGTLSSLKTPNFLKIAAEEYKPNTFESTEWDKENVKDENPKGVIRYQKDPKTGKLQSNTLVYKWSDGSITISVGGEHYEVSKKQMAPAANKQYQESQDAHLYAAAAHLSSNLLITVGHVSEQYTVLPNRNMQDDALAVFASRMAAAARGKAKDGDNIFTATRDPELQRKEAELAEKERMKAQRRRDNAAARISSGAGNYRSGGLSIGDLEGGRRAAGGARKRGQPGGARPKRRKPEYDSDDDLPAGRGRNDEYDREDDFIAPSDDENISEAEDDDEDLLDDDDEEEEEERRPAKKRQRTVEVQDEDGDADVDLDDAPAPAAESSRGRRRQIVDDDDDEE